jgi:hypothetical protein
MRFFRRSGSRDTAERQQVYQAEAGEQASWMDDYLVFAGHDGLDVVGESHYQDDIWLAIGGRRDPSERVRVDIIAVLAAEADNPYDASAISVWVDGRKVGYLSREDAQRYRGGLLALQAKCGKAIALPGVAVGGGIRDDGPGMVGIFLNHDPADFGLRPPHLVMPAAAGFRTALSDALATDEADDSYDLSWLAELPGDDIRAISVLRQLLAGETDLLSRHFMHAELENILYRSRDAFGSALGEYDQVCVQHDSEMDSLRPAFLAKWGRYRF